MSLEKHFYRVGFKLLKPLKQIFSEKLKSLEASKDPQKLADILDVDVRTIQRWLAGEVCPSESSRSELAKKLGKPEDWFFSNPVHGPDAKLLARLSLYRRISTLDDDQVTDVLEYISDRFDGKASSKPAKSV